VNPSNDNDCMNETLFNALYRGKGFGHFWVPGKTRNDTGITTWFDSNNIPKLPTTEQIYFGVFPSKVKKDKSHRTTNNDILLVSALIGDFDSKDFGSKELVLLHIENIDPQPSILISTGNGFHAYWLLENPIFLDDDNREETRQLLIRWVEYVGADTHAAKLTQLLRPVGTYNTKNNEKKPVEIVWMGEEITFTLHELENLLPPAKNMIKPDIKPNDAGIHHFAGDWHQTLEHWTNKALERARPGNRDHTGYWLAQQLYWSNLVTIDQAMQSNYPERVPQSKKQYTRKEYEKSVKSAYSGTPREPARKEANYMSNTQPTPPPPENYPDFEELKVIPPLKTLPALAFKKPGNYIETIPELNQDAQVPEELGGHACPWLDDYIEYSRKWSPRGYDGFHEVCGLWVLSTVASRRVGTILQNANHTSMYFGMIARSSLFAKTTTADIAIDLLRHAGLDFLLAPDSSTPQKFISDMGERLPSDYSSMKDDDKERAKLRLAMSGKRGWFYEEFGQQLAGMMRENGTMADFRGLLRRFDDGAESYEYATIGRGNERIKRPYLSLLANMTPADLRPYAKKGSSLWGDGFLARFALVTPPEGSRTKERFPIDKRNPPGGLVNTLRKWHDDLGIPNVTIDLSAEDEKDKYIIQPSKYTTIGLNEDAYEAFYQYHDSLEDIIDRSTNQDLDSNYARFAQKALRLAVLFASISGEKAITINHWAKAQSIAERWRSGLHELYNQLNTQTKSEMAESEEKIIQTISKFQSVTIREIGRIHNMSSGEVRAVVLPLVQSGALIEIKEGRTFKYQLG